MARANHYCATCNKHFTIAPERHVDIEHDGGLAQIERNGDWRDWERKQDHQL